MRSLRVLSLLVGALLAVAVGWFYYWTVGEPRLLQGGQQDYYNLLVHGFRQGSLAMAVTPDPWLGVDPARVQHFLLDASFHQGKYYLYFGVTPALLLFWPWALVTGHDLPEPLAVALLAALAFALSLGWLRTLQRRFVPEAGGWLLPASVLLLGLGAGYPVVLRHPLFYEVAILANAACTMGGLWCLTLALLRPAQSGRWLALASLCAGLAVGSRPTVGPGVLLALGVTAWAVGRPAGRSPRGWWRPLLAAGGPVAACLALLGWYNWARFGNPLEFGLRHQLGSNPHGFSFTLSSLAQNFRLYYLTPPSAGWYFPFFGPGDNPPGINREQVHGQFLALPLLLFALAFAGRAWWRRDGGDRRELVAAGAAVAAWAGVTMVIECMAPPHANRYQLDFHPVFLAWAGLALAAASVRPGWRAASWVVLAWLPVVVVFNLATSFHVHGFFQTAHPATYEKLARIINRDYVWPVHRLAGPEPGGVELVVRFPAGRPGAWEPLLVTGGGPDMDALFIEYTTPGRGRLVFDHLDFGSVRSEEFDLLPGKARWLKVYHGGLYPPRGHPWYRTQPPGAGRARDHLAIMLDGLPVLGRDMIFYQASPNQVSLGRRGGYLKGEEKFSGEIARVRTLGVEAGLLPAMLPAPDRVRLRLLLPRDRFGASEPLLLSGTPGRYDLVGISYPDAGHVQFSLLHDGWSEIRRSPPIPWDYQQPLELMLRFGTRPGATGPGLSIEMDDEVVWVCDFTPHPVEPTQVYLGCLPWPVSGYWRLLGGELAVVPDDGTEPRQRAVRQLLAGRPVNIRFALPAGLPPAGLPLLSTGITGRGDGLYLESLPDGRVRLGFDHWGSQPTLSAPVRLEPGRTHKLTVSFGARLSARETVRGRLWLQLDGATVLDEPADLFPCDASLVWFGENRPGLSTSQPRFPGELSLE